MKLLFVGDTILKKKDNIFLNDYLQGLIKESSIVSCNFEGPIKHKDSKPSIKAGPNIYQRDNSIEQLTKVGFNFFNLANNHIMDYGSLSLETTIDKLKGIDYTGAGKNFNEAYKLVIKNINNTKIGFLGFSEWDYGVIDKDKYKSGFAWVNHPQTNDIIKKSKQQCDILIVQIHAGEENIDLPQPYWRKRYKEIINNGADLIIGHHPHIGQPIEKYKGKNIIYSLGNFYFKDLNNNKVENYIVQITINNNIIEEPLVIPILQKDNLISTDKNNYLKTSIETIFKISSEEEYIIYYSKIKSLLWKERYYPFFNENPKLRLIKNFIKILIGKKVTSRETLQEHYNNKESHREIIKSNE